MNKFTEKIVCMIIPLLFAGSLYAQSAADAYRTEIFNTSDSPRVEISTQGGFIEVIGTNENEVIVEMFVRRGSRYLHADEEDLTEFDIEIAHTGNRVIVSSESRSNASGGSFWRRGRSLSVSFRVSVPFGSAVDGHTSGGGVSAEYIRNNLSLRTSGGRIRVVDVQGDRVALQTSGGSIELGRVAGNIEAKTSGGAIRGEVITGMVNLRTSGGSIQLSDVSAQVTARTSGGGITADITRFEEDVNLKTSGGSIKVRLASASHFDIDLRGNRVHAELNNFSGKAERNHVKGSMGRGGPVLTASTSGGSVTLDY